MVHKLSKIVQILFRQVSVERLLDSRSDKYLSCKNIDINYLHDLILTYHKEFTDTEIELQLEEVQAQMEQINVFDILSVYIPEVLEFHHNKVVCRYQKLQEWHELVRVTGEDLPVITMRVLQDFKQGTECENFAWKPIIGHNNTHLDRILSKGLADNHFHLRGSASYFDISWINLMNYPAKDEFRARFADIEKQRRNKNKKSEPQILSQTYWIMNIQAALIRLYLCSRLTHTEIKLTEYYINTETVWSYITKYEENIKKESIINTPAIQLDLYRDLLPQKVFKECWHYATVSFIEKMLQNPDLLEIHLNNIQKVIHGFFLNKNAEDYMLTFLSGSNRHDEAEYKILSGERWFLYHMMKKILRNDPELTDKEKNLFFAYIRIKNDIRSELIQVNDLIGFRNFQIYQERKDHFSRVGNILEEEGKIARLAVRDVLNNEAVRYLEVRISPGNTAEENLRDISGYDDSIIKPYNQDDLNVYEVNKAGHIHEKFTDIIKPYNQDDLNVCEVNKDGHIHKNFTDIMNYTKNDLRNRFYYVYHFTKQEDKLSTDEIEYECRHYQYRRKIERKANAIMEFRKNYPMYGQRILGIDACSMEVGCRPEVFGCIFRELKNYTYLNRDFLYDVELPQLRITYHVGEEFLDIIDGLRAVDEAVRFLGMDCGDRIGHALVLGLNVEKWYIFKRKQISLTLQDYLDNIAWMHHALIKYHIKNMSSLKGWLEEQYALYFNYIYLYSESNCGSKGYIKGKYDINSYYLSWLLRGDKPELYKFQNGKVVYTKPDVMDFYSILKEKPRKDDIRNIPEVIALYHMYHYNSDAKKRGREIKTFSINDKYIAGAIEIQKALREDIVQRGISVETNPTSNVNISVIKGYEEHPIKTLYNLGLTANEKEIMECPQMSVSINTDDKGVFSTRIENEYALLASALENVSSPDKKPLYKRECIYAWLDNIREMGLRQAFGNDGNIS